MKNIRLLFICLFLPVIFWRCDQLDYSEASDYTQDFIFNDAYLNGTVLVDIYSYLPADFNSIDGAMRSCASDDAEYVWDLSSVQKFNDGSWSAIQPLDDQWGHLYSGIRAANLFIDEMKKGRNFNDLKYNDEYAQLMKRISYYPYEARFLRAFFYFELIKRYGDVPLITTVLTEQEANKVTRTPFNTVVDFIVKECDSVGIKLPISFSTVPGGETGRATKGAALALKARTLLYAASPLNNPSGTQEKWIKAATASKAIIDANIYSLGSYESIVNNLTSPELIFETRQGATNTFEMTNFPIGFIGGKTGTCPTQNLVNAYEVKSTGKGIFESGSGFNPSNPYTDRDPRLLSTVLCNGSVFKNTPVEIWNGGLNAPPKLNATKTGYYLKKYVIESVSLDPTNPSTKVHVWVLFRLGEILLNYAEAMNEAYGPSQAGSAPLSITATDAVNQIRARAGMPPFPGGMTKEDFRIKLMNERRVELAFEDHRFWDIRRWKTGSSTTAIYGVDILKSGTGTLSYKSKLVETRVWNDKMYLYPIPQTELYINNSLTQNSGW
jgi:hypothetical protein